MSRNYIIDLLKAISLICIILAHVNPPKFIFEIRNFDVPLMIILSVWLSIRSIEKENFSYKKYLKKRFKRLLLPTWIFLIIYFSFCAVFNRYYSLQTIILSFTLMGGIGYVWVIRIYVYVAILTPFLKKIVDKLKIKQIAFYTLVMYLIYEVIYFTTNNITGIEGLLISCFIWDILGYSFIILFALLIIKKSSQNLYKIGINFAILFLSIGFLLNFPSTQEFKYPVRIYYLSYSFSIGILLYNLVNYYGDKLKLYKSNIILFLSENSMWIYLWHIIFIDMIKDFFVVASWGFILRLVVVLIGSCIIVWFQNQVTHIIKKYINYTY